MYGRCTAGFTAKDLITETEGVLTAGHCPDDAPEYDGSRGVLKFFRRASGQVDSQFFMTITPAHATTKQFTNGLGGAVDVQSVGNPSVGDYVCKYGISTERTCGKVTEGQQCLTLDGSQHCHLYTMQSDVAWPVAGAKGDSGGPVYSGSRAHGLVSGGQTDGRLLYFTAISWVEDNNPVRVLRVG